MLHHSFIVYAVIAGTAVATLCGPAGYFLVLRNQVFAGDALGHIAYTGAMAALVVGLDLRAGLFVGTVLVGLILGAGGRRGGDDVAIGSFFSWVLGLGVLFLTYYTLHGSHTNGAANVNVLFGSIFGLSAHAAEQAVLVSVAAGLVLVAIARPLLFATVDPAVAAAQESAPDCWARCSSASSAPPSPRRARSSVRCSCSGCLPHLAPPRPG